MMSSSESVLAMLRKTNPTLKIHALSNLNKLLPQFWPEISNSLPILECLYEDEKLDQHLRQLAALLISKLFYYLGELNDSLSFALGAGSLIHLPDESEYLHTLRAKAIDEYASLRSKAVDSNEVVEIAPILEAIVDGMLDKCISDGKYQQAAGIAIECGRFEKLEEAITKSADVERILSYCVNVSHSFINRRQYRHEVLRLLVNVYQKLASPDYLSICQCLLFLDDPHGVASILEKLLRSESRGDALLALQISFDLVENERQAFLMSVRDRLPAPKIRPVEAVQAVETSTAQNENTAGDVQMRDETPSQQIEHETDFADPVYAERLTKVKGILSGETSIKLTRLFFETRSKSDLLILKNIKQSTKMQNNVCHRAIIFANAIMHAGTEVDTFIKKNLNLSRRRRATNLLRRTKNWAQFSAVAALGVIHRGCLQFVEADGYRGCYYTGGAMYALGLSLANHGEGITQFLRDILRREFGATEIDDGASVYAFVKIQLTIGKAPTTERETEEKTTVFLGSLIEKKRSGKP